jgi:hypothetical protein
MNPHTRDKVRESVVAVVFLLLGAWICLEALQVGLGSFRMPGAGFFPLVLGVILGAFAIVAAVWLFERAGFLLTMAMFAAVAMKLLGKMSWLRRDPLDLARVDGHDRHAAGGRRQATPGG